MAHKRDKPGKSCCKCVLQKTMKGADKAIVAKSFGKWNSSSLRSRTMEKPDEPSGESKEESLSKYTCADPQLGKKPVGKSVSFPYFKSIRAAVCFGSFYPRFSVNYYCGDVCGLFFIYLFIFCLSHLTLWSTISGEQTNHIVGQENSFWGKVCLRWYGVARKRQSKK